MVRFGNTGRGALMMAGGAILLYCLFVLAVVSTVSDFGIRWLLVDATIPSADAEPPNGIVLLSTPHLETRGPRPVTGDRLLEIGDWPINSSIDAARAGLQPPLVLDPWLTLGFTGGEAAEWTKLRFRTAAGEPRETLVKRQPLPISEISLTLLWFVCELGIFAVGAFAFWTRPFDRPARLFFGMCIVTLGAFVGGFHWWVLAGSIWMTLPFAVCAILVPVVTLHFFLVYPRPKQLITRWPIGTKIGLYAIPAIAIFCFLLSQVAISWAEEQPHAAPWQLLRLMNWLRLGIYVYLTIAAMYFVTTIAALVHSVVSTRNLLERRQVTSILWAGLIATIFIGYSLLLAYFDRVTFALGGARVPMFLASLVFMISYALGIVRYKLMLTEGWTSHGLWNELARFSGAVVCAVAAITLGLAVGRETPHLAFSQVVSLAVVLMILVVAGLWGRDSWQRWIERRSFREKYRLERALQRINRAVGQFADPQYLSERTLAACRDVLRAEWAALYLRDRATPDTFRLSAVDGDLDHLPLEFAGDATVALVESATSNSVGAKYASATNRVSAEVVQPLEVDGEPLGYLALGPKQSGAVYTPEDGTFLAAMTQLTGVALHCVRVHQDLTHLNEELKVKVERIARQKQQILVLQSELAATRTSTPPIAEPAIPEFRRDLIRGSSTALEAVLSTARKAAASDATVLLRGESGTGKELLARAIHDNSQRRAGPMITVHCAALAPSLLESELFGHVRGAFTGAATDRRGRFELAQGGTLFLDEIGEITPETQVKLLRVLQQREIEPVGGAAPIKIDVRVVAATHRDLEAMIADGRFREDLYYRLNVISLTLPPLRDRREDLHELAAEFLKKACEQSDKRVVDFDDAALDALLQYEWPGNIRELQNVIERAVVLADQNVITLSELPADLRTAAPRRVLTPAAEPRGRPAPLKTKADRTALLEPPSWRQLDAPAERRLLLSALEHASGNKAQAARTLGLPRSTFFSKLKKHGLD